MEADTFVYVPFVKSFTPDLETELELLGPAVTSIVVPDVDRRQFEERTFEEFHDPRSPMRYAQAPGPWRAPLFGQMGSSLWVYHNQHMCRRMVESYERQRGRLYDWVIFARADMFWTQSHPPLGVLDPAFLHIPIGQDNSGYDGGAAMGINDRHAVVPRKWFSAYFSRWQAANTK